MAATARYISDSGADGIKLQLLHILKGTDLAAEYYKGYIDVFTMDEYIDTLLDTNSLDFLPDGIKAMYTISDCYTYVPLTQELIDKWQKTIITTIDYIKFRERGYQETKSDKCFWDKEESVKNQSYYFAVLCSYSPRLHLPYKSYLEKLEKAKSGVDLLGGGCDELTDGVADTSDMSWLDEIFAEL
jgi:hypothetical protein